MDATTKDITIRPTSNVTVEALSFQILRKPVVINYPSERE
jgi:hypothetical protein